MSAILLPYRGRVLLTTAWSVSERYEGDGIIVSFAHDCGSPFKISTSPEVVTVVFPGISMVEFLDRVKREHAAGAAFIDLTG